MRSEFLLRHRVSLASVLVVFAAVIAVVLYALSVPGYATHRAEINDGGVWVTKNDSGQFGRLNKPISQLDGYDFTENQAGTYDIDVVQEGASVIAVDHGSGAIYPMGVTRAKLLIPAKVPVSGNAQVAMAGGTVAVLDPAKGSVTAVVVEQDAPIADLAGLAGKPLASAGPGAALAVSQDGTIYAASSTSLVTIRRAGAAFAKPVSSKIKTQDGAIVTVTAVGDEPVVLARPKDSSTGTLILPGGKTAEVDAATNAVLQQAGPAAVGVLISTPGGLRSVPLDGGEATTLAKVDGGKPAAPVLLRGCSFAAWAGPAGEFARTCKGTPTTQSRIKEASDDLVFRVNRDKVMLNDRTNGRVWNLDKAQPRPVDNWDAITKPRDNKKNHTKDDEATTNNRPQPPKPQPDTNLGARPGRTTSLYVLDNDSDPSGGVLAVSSITAKGGDTKLLSISPDGQTVDLQLPPGRDQPVNFSYTINGAKGTPVAADVSVEVRKPSENSRPKQRANIVPRTWTVPVGGTVTIPVLGDWRDYADGDPVVLSAASVKTGGGIVSTTPDGQLIYSAPDKPGMQTIEYTVADGFGGATKGSVAITVQGPNDTAVPAVAAPDYVRGQAGKPITIQPLANDLPGSDPNSPTATLRLAANIASPAGAPVTTDLTTGTVTITPSKPGALQLSYQAAYGYATPAKGVIAIQVDPEGAPQPPVTAADTAVLHGQTAVTVDVLANDADPAGNLLVVQRAVVTDPTLAAQLEIAVLDGRYVQLRSRVPTMTPTVQSVQYTVTDGVTGDATGSITVTQLPATNDGPVTLDDYAKVRSDQAVGVAVLDNDSSPSGSPLTLSKNVYGAPHAGELVVMPATAGAAYVSGRIVRFVANPVAVTTAADISYVAEDVAGTTQEGRLHITIVPPQSKTNLNQQPLPPPLEGRATAGQTIRIKVPSSGVDPDGDPVVVTGIGSAPTRGRVLSTTARGIEYQAYPFIGNGGTDTFSYVVTDIYGASNAGAVRVAVVTPGDPQPPVAVDDTITTSPDTPVQVDVLANDIAAPGDRVTVLPLPKTDVEVGEGHVKLDSDRGPITVTSGTVKVPVSFKYRISNGVSEASAQVTVRAADGANLPPVAFDEYPAVTPGASSVDVDLTKSDYDPDGTTKPVVVTPVGAVGGKVNLKLRNVPQAVPYVIRDEKGATATAVVYLPAIGAGAPVVKPGSLIKINSGATKTVDITDYVVDPAKKPVITTVDELITTSPAEQLTKQKATDGTHVTLTATKGYNGPAALTFQVTNGKSVSDPAGLKSLITVPVQVGDDRPVLRCPTTPLQLVEGGQPKLIRPSTYCHTWTPNLSDLDTLPFKGTWKTQPAGVTVSGSGTPTLRLVADSSASKAGASGELTVSANGATGALKVVVIEAPKLEVSPLTVDGVQAGQKRQIDLASSLRSYLAKPTLGIVGTPTVTGSSVTAAISTSGSRLSVTPAKDAKGTMRIRYVATDVPQQDRTDHQTAGEITLHLIGRPDAPTNVQPDRTVLSKTVKLRWTAPAANGTPITKYVARYSGGQQDCGAAPACTVTGLANGRAYSFTVIAYNAIDASLPSTPSGSATPDAVPTAVQGFTVSSPQDQQVTLKWQALSGEFSSVLKYRILGGPTPIETSATTVVANGLDNNQQYTFAIVAINKKGPGPSATGTGLRQSAGRPGAPQDLEVGYVNATNTSSTDVQVSWSPVQGAEVEGPTPIKYKVTRTPGGVVNCPELESTCVDSTAKYGQSYTYTITARNAADDADPGRHVSDPSTTPSFEVATKPDQVANYSIAPTGQDGTAKLSFDAPASHGKTSTVKCTRSGGSDCGSWTYSPDGQTGQSVTINGLPDGDSTGVTLVDCNGSTDSNNADRTCGDPLTKNVTTYGPIAPVQLDVSANGTRIYWNFSGDANGKSAHISVRTSKGYTKDFDRSGGFSDSDSEDVGYQYTDTVTVTVTDNGRATQQASRSARSVDPPPKQYEVRHPGGDCGKGRNCVQVRIINFVQGGSAQCSATGSTGVKDWGPVTLAPGPDGSSAWVGTATQGTLFDTSAPYTYANGAFDLGHDNNGLTCN